MTAPKPSDAAIILASNILQPYADIALTSEVVAAAAKLDAFAAAAVAAERKEIARLTRALKHLSDRGHEIDSTQFVNKVLGAK